MKKLLLFISLVSLQTVFCLNKNHSSSYISSRKKVEFFIYEMLKKTQEKSAKLFAAYWYLRDICENNECITPDVKNIKILKKYDLINSNNQVEQETREVIQEIIEK